MFEPLKRNQICNELQRLSNRADVLWFCCRYLLGAAALLLGARVFTVLWLSL
jgi:hypothetical protein